ncbi:MAG: hypothetical protein RR659_04820, partial [Bacilli bacterium]
MKNKKLIFAIILFFIFGTIVYTFATPDQKLEKDNTVEKGSSKKEDSKKKESKKKVKNEEEVIPVVVPVLNNNGNNNGLDIIPAIPEKDGYEEALKAYKKVCETLNVIDYESAYNLMLNVKNVDKKNDLNKNLKDIKSVIDATKLLEKIEAMVNTADSKNDINSAKELRKESKIDEVLNGNYDYKNKKEVLERLENLSNIFNDKKAPLVKGINDKDIVSKNIQIKVTDDNLVVITLNGKEFNPKNKIEEEGTYTL